MRRNVAAFVSIIVLWAVLTACTDSKTLEKMGLITTVGYDLSEDGKILTTMVLLQIDPEAPKNTGFITGESITSKGARIAADLKSPKKLQSGQLRVALYGEEVAEDGIINLADTLSRDPSISDLTYLGIVEGSANEILKQENQQFTDIGQFIYKELDQNIKGELIPSSTLQEFTHDFYAAGVDPSLPTLKAENGMVRITGMALMNDDKMVGKISAAESFYLKLINDRYEAGNLELIISKNGFQNIKLNEEKELAVVLDTIRSNSKMELQDKENLTFKLTINIDSRLLEINQSIDLKNPKNIQILEKTISNTIKKNAEDLLAYAKAHDSDVFGFGEVYRSSVYRSGLTKEKWHEMYKNIRVNVKVNFQIVRTGVVE
ncbi:Ger(x)C family spore germination protein [Cytobacillus sp. FSL H8-0458]|uniref:Ger(x)C family spore germination protein n=1 Tax=Cytobacillus sp. FSL H8-0458 TaxID=2975346 RepID=UPI0030F70EDD